MMNNKSGKVSKKPTMQELIAHVRKKRAEGYRPNRSVLKSRNKKITSKTTGDVAMQVPSPVPSSPFTPVERTDGIELKKGECYISRDGRPAMILETDMEANIIDNHCFGYWVETGEEFQWQPDGGIEEFETSDDLVAEVSLTSLRPRHVGRLESGFYYWSVDGRGLAKILATDIRRYADTDIKGWRPTFGDDPCIGYWLDGGAAVDAWSSRGYQLYGSRNQNLDVSSKSDSTEIDWYLRRLKEEYDPNPPKQIRYWVPQGLSEEIQWAVSVSKTPPANTSEFCDRIEFLLCELAEDCDYYYGRGKALDIAKCLLPNDCNIFYADSDISPHVLADVLMHSDFVHIPLFDEILGWKCDDELQEACDQRDFREVLSALSCD